MTEAIRLRYAPRPAGGLAEARVALCNYLYARQNKGALLLRLADGAEDSRSDLRWLGLFDAQGAEVAAPPRGDDCQQAARRLVEAGRAYWCADGTVLRYRAPEKRDLVFHDLIRGEVRVPWAEIGDFVVYCVEGRDGFPMPNLARVVDDHALGVTHVLQEEGDLPDAARQILLHQALGYAEPRFGHLPALAVPGGEDITLRRYAAEGYLPEAVCAYLATLLGVSAGHVEQLSLMELTERFDLQRAAHPPLFDPERLLWFNKQRLRTAEMSHVAALLRPRLEAAYGAWERSRGTAYDAQGWYDLLVSSLQAEVATLDQMVALGRFCFVERITEFTDEARQALAGEGAREVLAYCQRALTAEAIALPDDAALFYQQMRHHFRDTAGLRGRLVMFPIRAALTGTLVGPCLGIVTALLGYTRCMERLEDCLG